VPVSNTEKSALMKRLRSMAVEQSTLLSPLWMAGRLAGAYMKNPDSLRESGF
jgi:hypothetical protein